ncbi:MAG: RagB/SusD family nutrient uptake outer membrane protein [Dysgonamonadaceae bacterium]|jgi:hypothetical protein|nr:RagB/SusD family nutrient uptake outer membrane protein [Dysgonamonadaceae bacterium]
MNRIFKFKIALLLMIMASGFGACDYLEIAPDNVPTIEYAFNNRYNAQRYLYTCYSFRPAIGDLDYDPAMGGADETWQYISYSGFNIYRTFAPARVARNEQTVTEPLFNHWDGRNYGQALWTGIRNCNIFLDNIPNVKVDMIETERTRWIAEAKFLKAYYHWYLLRMYGPIPIMDVNLPISASVSEVKVWRQPIDDVVEYIISLLNDAIPDLPNASEIMESSEAGRADKLIAYTLIADIRLWAASPLVNGNSRYRNMVDNRGVALFPQSEDPNKWALAVQACDSAIIKCEEQRKELYTQVEAHTLTQHPVFQLQSTLRQVIGDRWNSELIWGSTNYSNSTLQQYVTPRILQRNGNYMNDLMPVWVPTLKMVELFYSSRGVPIDEDTEWRDNSWYIDRYNIRPETPTGDEVYLIKQAEKTVYLHYNREPRFYADIAFDKGIYFGNGYYTFATAQYCNFLNTQWSGFNPGTGYSVTGYATKKLHGFTNSQTATTHTVEYFPFPIYRLADLYLMYAEAVNEAEGPDGPNSAKMFAYLNEIRQRAGLEDVKESWRKYSTKPEKPNSKEGLREIIRRERTIELMFEGKRFWDLRRWDKIDELNDQPKGWKIEGETPDDFYKVSRVYDRVISFTAKDYFFPIREYDLYVNDNLVQNYGW